MTHRPDFTIFTSPKPFVDSHITTIQRNAIQSWIHLGPEVEVFLIGAETGLAETAAEFGVTHLPEVRCNAQGTPLVSSIFDLARRHSAGQWLVYVNADILFLPDLLDITRRVADRTSQFLLVGQRWDLDVIEPIDFSSGWSERLKVDVQQRGRLHEPAGSDYFVFPRCCFQAMPDFAIGRAGWDNWMIFYARQQHWLAVDASHAIMVVHQTHDYRHLPGGQVHYKLPETFENVRLAGGRRVIFTLKDADYHMQDGQLSRIPRRGKKLLREMEIWPLVSLHSRFLGEFFFMFFHPCKAWGEIRGRLVYLWKRVRRKG